MAGAVRSPLLVPSVLLVVYLVVRPPVADLAAQVARADVVRSSDSGVWWTGWFGGVTLPTYSTVSPWLMAVLGVPLTGALAAVVALLGAGRLFRSAPRPALATAAFGVMDVADLFCGRITFALGLALGVLCLLAVARPRTALSLCCSFGLAVLCCLTSPLAGLFTGLAALAVVLAEPRRRIAAALASSALLASGAALAVLFPDPGRMPTTVLDVLPALAVALGVALLCRPRVVRVCAVLTAGATVLFTVVPGAVGANMVRLPWILGAPVVIGFARLPLRRRPLRRPVGAALLAAAAVAASLAPGVDLAHQLSLSGDRSASAAFYAPLLEELQVQRTARPRTVGARVEVVDPRTHWSAVYVAGQVPLARGWNRQADAALNPIFYEPGALTARSYTDWLHSLAVGWVALPHTPLDYAAVAEGRLVASGLPGLRPVWSRSGWTLYRVVDPTPLADGARVVSSQPGGVLIDVPRPGTVLVRVRWSPYLTATRDDPDTDPDTDPDIGPDARPDTGPPAATVCPRATADGMTTVELPAGRWRLTSDLALDATAWLDGGCGTAAPAADQKPMPTRTTDRAPSTRRSRTVAAAARGSSPHTRYQP